MEVRPDAESAPGLEQREHFVARRARVGRRLEHDEVARPEPCRDLARCAEDDREVGLSLAGERRRQRDQDRAGVAEHVVVGCGAQAALGDESCEHLRGHVLDHALAAVDLRDALGVDVEEDDGAAGLREHLRERDTDVSRADDRDVDRRRLAVGRDRRRLGCSHGGEC